MPAETIRVAIEGGRELNDRLKELPRKVERDISRKALRAGAKVIHAEAKRTAPVSPKPRLRRGFEHKPGTLRRNIKVRAGKRRRDGRISFFVQNSKGDYKGEAFYAAFVEYGHRVGKRNRKARRIGTEKRKPGQKGQLRGIYTVDSRRMIPPKPFMKPAFESKKDQALAVVLEVTRAGIEAAAKQ